MLFPSYINNPTVSRTRLRSYTSRPMLETLSALYFEAKAEATSRVCAVARYAVLEANAKVSGRGQISHRHSTHTPEPILMSPQKILLRPPRESMCTVWFGAIQPLRFCTCVKKCAFYQDFFVNRSIYPLLHRVYRSVLGDFNG